MSQNQPPPLHVAVRVYPEWQVATKRGDAPKRVRFQTPWKCPDAMLVFDTETRTDAAQRLTFGSYRFIVAGRCLEEGLFYGDDLPKKDLEAFQRYVATHVAEAANKQLRLLTRRQFLAKFYSAAYKGRCLIVGFVLPFDLSRIPRDFASARGRFAGGFSLGVWSYIKNGREFANKHRPCIGIKHIDSKRHLIGFTARRNPDQADLIPEGSETGQPKPGYKFRGHFLDLRMLAFALTDKSYSLASACEDFGVDHPKQSVARHGIVTPEYIDYNRRDVLATWELAVKLLEEYDRHPINLEVTKAYSPASIGKAYLHAMGVEPILDRQPDFPREYLGYAQTAFFGGRTSAHVRKVAVPVVYTDFLSMYPTVNSLMGLWRFVIAHEIKIIPHCQAEIERFLNQLTADGFFKPAAWKELTAFVRVIPNGDLLPSRARYSVESHDWQIGLNHLYPQDDDPNNALWFSLPDVVATVILTKRMPKIVDAFRIEPHGILPGLNPVKLRGVIEVDPRSEDFFKVVIEERKRLSLRNDLSDLEKKRLDKALKVLANATSYGIYAEMIRQESDRKVKVVCHGIDTEPFTPYVKHPDVPGEFCFPPLASLITGAARLMLALLEYSVSEFGGTYAMEDTDSMAIVATEQGGTIRCHEKPVKALTWNQVQQISQRFAVLNPYDRAAIPGSILKIENDNFDPTTGRQRQIHCLAISAKRYALFLLGENGSPVLLRSRVNNEEDRWSEHGLGHLLNPTDPESEDREWIAQAWLSIIREILGLLIQTPDFEASPAVSRTTVSSPAVIRPLAKLNEGKPYADQIKPFNFLLTCHVKALGHPIGTDPEQFHLIGPYENDPTRWLKLDWIDQHTGRTYRITTEGYHGSRNTARVKTYGDILTEYEFHPESKCADAEGDVCRKQTVGLLQRRHIRVGQIKYIGKESNSLEEVESGLIHAEQNVYTEYPDPRRDEWQTKIWPALKRAPLSQLVEISGMSRSALKEMRAGRSRPHPKNQETLASIVQKLRQKVHDPEREG